MVDKWTGVDFMVHLVVIGIMGIAIMNLFGGGTGDLVLFDYAVGVVIISAVLLAAELLVDMYKENRA